MKKKQDNKIQISDSLFFKVFRNLVIRNTILGFIKCGFKINNYEYNSIISTEFMIKNRLFQLLYEKVIRSEYLIFNNDIDGPNYNDNNNGDPNSLNSYIEDTNGRIIMKKEYSIFNCFKTNGDNNSKGYQFYKSLFKNYSKQFPSKDQLFTIGVEYDNLSILYVLKDEYSIPRKSVKQSINSGSFKCAKLILNHFISKISSTSNNNETFIIDLIKDTIGNFQKQLGSDNEIELYNKKVDFLFKYKEIKLKFQENVELVHKSFISLHGNGFYKMFIYQKSLQLVIKCCRTLIHLKLCSFINKFSGLNRKDNFYLSYEIEQDFKLFKIPSIENFEKMISNCNFTKEEMETKICDLGGSKEKLEVIKLCFKMLILFTNEKYELYSNWFFYQIKYFNLNYYNGQKDKIKMPELDNTRFGLYNSTVGIDYQLLSKQQIENTFSYCKFNWDIQKSFFINAIKEIKSGIAGINLLDDLIKIACESSFSIELLDLAKSELRIKSLSIRRLKSFKTIQLVDYVLKNFNGNGNGINKDHFSSLLQLNLFNYQIANHLKTNYQLEFENEITLEIDTEIHNLNANTINYLDLKFIQENWTESFQVQFGPFILLKFNDCNEFEQFIKTNLSSIRKMATKNKPINFYGPNKRLSIYQTNYMYNLKSQLFLNNSFMPPPDPISFVTRYLRNEFINLFNIDSNNNNNGTILPNSKSVYMVLNEISKRGDIKTLDFLLSDKFNDKEFKKYIIKYVLFKSSKYGQLSILQYFKSNEKSLDMEINFLKLYSSITNSNTISNYDNSKEKKRNSKKKNQNYFGEDDNDDYSKLFKSINEITIIDNNYSTIYKKSFKEIHLNNHQFIDINLTIDDWHFIFIKYLLPNGYIKLIKFITSIFQYNINLSWLNDLIGKEKHLISINNYLILPQILFNNNKRN